MAGKRDSRNRNPRIYPAFPGPTPNTLPTPGQPGYHPDLAHQAAVQGFFPGNAPMGQEAIEVISLAQQQYNFDEINDINGKLESGRGYWYDNLADKPVSPNSPATYADGTPVDTSALGFADPANETQFPTNTKNPERPRTVGAAWNPTKHTLTVIFRDGTFYNYYEISRREWESFKATDSPGQYIALNLDSKPRGFADVTDLDPQIRLMAVTAARMAQMQNAVNRGHNYKPKRSYTVRARSRSSYTSGF